MSLGYESLLSRFVPMKESQLQMKTAEVGEAKGKLLDTGEQLNVLLSHWRMEMVSSLCKVGRSDLDNDATVTDSSVVIQIATLNHVGSIPEDHHCLSSCNIANQALRVFMGYV